MGLYINETKYTVGLNRICWVRLPCFIYSYVLFYRKQNSKLYAGKSTRMTNMSESVSSMGPGTGKGDSGDPRRAYVVKSQTTHTSPTPPSTTSGKTNPAYDNGQVWNPTLSYNRLILC